MDYFSSSSKKCLTMKLFILTILLLTAMISSSGLLAFDASLFVDFRLSMKSRPLIVVSWKRSVYPHSYLRLALSVNSVNSNTLFFTIICVSLVTFLTKYTLFMKFIYGLLKSYIMARLQSRCLLHALL